MTRSHPTPFRRIARVAGILAATLLAAAAAPAAPMLVGYQGAIFDAEGFPIEGPVALEVAVYDAVSGGNELYRESHSGVALVDGAFDVEIGGGSPLVGQFDAETFASDQTWLEIRVDGELLGPRQRMVSVPYALRAAVADSLDASIGTVPHALVADALSTAYGAGGSGTVLSVNTDEYGVPYDDGARVHFDNDYFGANLDALVFEKNDYSNTTPDGGIAFAYRQSDGTRKSSMVIRGDNVGMGIDDPQARLHVLGGAIFERTKTTAPAVKIIGNGGWSANPSLHVTNTHANGRAGRFDATSTEFAATFSNAGSGVGVYVGNNGQGAEKAALVAKNFNPAQGMAGFLHNESDYATAHLQNQGTGEVLYLQNKSSAGTGVGPGSQAFIVGVDEASNLRFWIDSTGMAHVRALEILGGSDLSERFDVSELPEAPIEPGMLVAIDPEQPEGALIPSQGAYARTVAGIIAGAGGVEPGMLMGQQGMPVVDGEHPVALTGRVYAKADTSNGPIRPGDLLTTSERAGHAMKATDWERSQGAVIGKALGSLDEETGLVLVLVGLQ